MIEIKNILKKIKDFGLDLNLIINSILWIFLSLILFKYGEGLNQSKKDTVDVIKDNLLLFKETYLDVYKLNMLLFLAITSFALVFRRARIFLFLIPLLLTGLYFGNYTLVNLRGTPLIWVDLFLLEEALGMAGNYGINNIFIFLVIGIALILGICFILFKTEKPKSKLKIINPFGLLIFLIMFGAYCNQVTVCNENKSLNIMNWDMPNSYRQNGFLISFLETKAGFKVDKPSDYSSSKIKDIISNIEYSKTLDEKPNLIFVQLESFIDVERISEASLKKDPIPTFRKLYENYTSGYVQVPTFGGGTVRSEFEALTGLSTDYLPVGAIPNNDILKKEPVVSLAQTMKSDGYETSFVHNYTGTFYDRNEVMSNYGFDNFISKEYMAPSKYNDRVYPEDTLSIEPIKTLLENSETPQFIYNVTVESHGSYNNQRTSTEYVREDGLTTEERNELEDYCIRLAGVDEFIEELIDTINEVSRPTVIVFFSDHLPSMSVINKDSGSIDSKDKYSTEVIVWDNISSNHDKDNLDLELYHLSSYVTNRYGFKQSIIDGFHNTYYSNEDYNSLFENIQYDMLYGKKYSIDEYSKYIKTNLTFGLKDTKLTSYELSGDVVFVYGENFNPYSKIVTNGKIIYTEFINENTLTTGVSLMHNGEFKVSQVGIVGNNSKIISSSNSINYVK